MELLTERDPTVLFCREHKGSLRVSVQVQPRAKKSAVVGIHGDHLKIKIASAPIEGAANEELVRFFAKFLEVPKSRVDIIQGLRAKLKVVEIADYSVSEFTSLLIKEGFLTISLG